jgi:hypothetical protein
MNPDLLAACLWAEWLNMVQGGCPIADPSWYI